MGGDRLLSFFLNTNLTFIVQTSIGDEQHIDRKNDIVYETRWTKYNWTCASVYERREKPMTNDDDDDDETIKEKHTKLFKIFVTHTEYEKKYWGWKKNRRINTRTRRIIYSWRVVFYSLEIQLLSGSSATNQVLHHHVHWRKTEASFIFLQQFKEFSQGYVKDNNEKNLTWFTWWNYKE